jgi:hypothetical protein
MKILRLVVITVQLCVINLNLIEIRNELMLANQLKKR